MDKTLKICLYYKWENRNVYEFQVHAHTLEKWKASIVNTLVLVPDKYFIQNKTTVNLLK